MSEDTANLDTDGIDTKAVQALKLRVSGATFRQIAVALGYAGPSGAHGAVTRALQQHREAVDEVIALELERLDRATLALWPHIIAEISEEPDAGAEAYNRLDKAIHRYLQISKRRADLLGLDAAKKINITQRLIDMAEREGLDPADVLREAERLLAEQD